MASRIIYFSEDQEEFTVVNTRFTDDLSSHIKGRAYWLNLDHLGRSQYRIVISDGTPLAVEFINHHWYLISWRQGCYVTKQSWKLSKGSYETGWYQENNPANPNFQQPSPLEARVTSDPESSPTTASSCQQANDLILE